MSLANPLWHPNQPAKGKARAAYGTGAYSQRKRKRLAAMLKFAPLPQSPDAGTVYVSFPLRTTNGLNNQPNSRQQAIIQSQQHKRQKGVTYGALLALGRPLPPLPWSVTLTRVRQRASGRKMDDDGLAASLKYVRDAVAEAAGVDDGNRKMISFMYAQDTDPNAGAGLVQIRIETRTGERA